MKEELESGFQWDFGTDFIGMKKGQLYLDLSTGIAWKKTSRKGAKKNTWEVYPREKDGSIIMYHNEIFKFGFQTSKYLRSQHKRDTINGNKE